MFVLFYDYNVLTLTFLKSGAVAKKADECNIKLAQLFAKQRMWKP